MGVVWTIVLNGMLGLAGYRAARDGFRQPAGLARGLAAATLAWAWATLGMEVLGAAGWLARGPLLAWTALGLGIALALGGRRRPPEKVEAPGDDGRPWDFESIVAVGLVLWAATEFGAVSLLLPVKVVSDGPIYHLYFAARWWKEGRLSLIAAPFGENAATYFPAVGDLWFAWLMTCWGGDRLAKVGQAPFWLASALAVFGMARRLGARVPSALIAVAWFATTTPLMLFTFEANVDAIFVAGYLLAAFFALRYGLGDARAGTIALAGLAAGGALGSKAIGIVFVPVLLALAALVVLRRRAGLGERLVHAGLLAACPLVMAGFWYGRNAWLTGNPLYPLHLVIGGRIWLSGWYGPGAMRLSTYYIDASDWRAVGDILLGVFDPRLVPFWAAALLGLWRLGGARPPRDAWVWGASALAVANVALYWLVIPYRTQQRFMLHAVGLAAVPLARLLDLSRGVRLAALGLLAVHLLTPMDWPFRAGGAPWDLTPRIPAHVGRIINIPGPAPVAPGTPPGLRRFGPALPPLAIGLAAMGVAWAWGRAGNRPTPGRLLRAAVAGAVLVGLGAGLLWARPIDPRLLFYPPFVDYLAGWLVLESRAGPAGARIAYAGTNIPYYLLGTGLRNEVRYINVDARRSWLLHDYHREATSRGEPTWPGPRPGWDRIRPDYDAWLANLRAERIQILVVARVNPLEGPHNVADAEGFPIERVWAESHPEVFEPLYGVAERDPRFRVYRVRPGPAG